MVQTLKLKYDNFLLVMLVNTVTLCWYECKFNIINSVGYDHICNLIEGSMLTCCWWLISFTKKKSTCRFYCKDTLSKFLSIKANTFCFSRYLNLSIVFLLKTHPLASPSLPVSLQISLLSSALSLLQMASEGILLGMGNPLLDISALVDQDFLKKQVIFSQLSLLKLRSIKLIPHQLFYLFSCIIL